MTDPGYSGDMNYGGGYGYQPPANPKLKQRGTIALGLSIAGLLFGLLAIIGLIMGIMTLNEAKSVGDVEAAKYAKYAVIAGGVVVTLNVVFSVLYVMGSM